MEFILPPHGRYNLPPHRRYSGGDECTLLAAAKLLYAFVPDVSAPCPKSVTALAHAMILALVAKLTPQREGQIKIRPGATTKPKNAQHF